MGLTNAGRDDFAKEGDLAKRKAIAEQLQAQGAVLRVQTLFEGDEFGWSAVLTGRGKHFQARALEPTDTLAFGGADLLKAFHEDPAFGLAFTLRLLGVALGGLWFDWQGMLIVLALLGIGVVVVTIIAWFAILFTGRYPRGIFEFNLGVLRWTWRVLFYSFGANGTDRYPPFRLS